MSTPADTTLATVQAGHPLTADQAAAINRMTQSLMSTQGCLMAGATMLELGIPFATETMKTKALDAVAAYDAWAVALRG